MFGTWIGRTVKTYDYINRVVITLLLTIYKGMWTPLTREGRTKNVMQVLRISMYDYLWNTCLHYIDELELVSYYPRL